MLKLIQFSFCLDRPAQTDKFGEWNTKEENMSFGQKLETVLKNYRFDH